MFYYSGWFPQAGWGVWSQILMRGSAVMDVRRSSRVRPVVRSLGVTPLLLRRRV